MGREQKARSGAAPVQAPAARPELTDAQLERIAEDTSRMDRGERVAYWDKRQARNHYGVEPYGPDVVMCPNDPAHGALQMMGSGAMLICQERKGGAWCTGSMPVSQ